MEGSRVADQLLRTVTALPTITSADGLDVVVSQMMRGVIDCDEVIRTELDLTATSATVRRGAELVNDGAMAEKLARVATAHPAVASYLHPGDDGAPRRVSDVVPDRVWMASDGYNEVFRADGARFQLSLVVHLTPTRGTGWVLTRSLSDFSDDDVAVARLLLPEAVALDALAARLRAESGDLEQVGVLNALTARELEVLNQAATGCTAYTIGRVLGISEGPVRKHLEHAYAKLGAHGRVAALNAVRGTSR
jgi:DNA-binding CsgD family transcriptional regulator